MKFDLQKAKEYGSIEFLAKQLVDGFITGLHKSPYHGFSVEFAEHRLYNYGESTRHIDWKVFARTDRLYTKQYEEETNLRCYVVLDHSSSMQYPIPGREKLLFSAYGAACLAYMLHRQRDAVGLITFSDKVELQTQIKSTASHVHKIFTQLEEVIEDKSKKKKTDVSSIIHEIADKINRRSLVIIFTDAFQANDLDSLFSSLQHLKHNRHEVLFFHVTDHSTELNFEFEDRPYKFYDLEEDIVLKLTPTEYKKMYQEKMTQYYNAIKLRAGQLKIDFIEADVKDDFDKILSAYLIKRSRMK